MHAANKANSFNVITHSHTFVCACRVLLLYMCISIFDVVNVYIHVHLRTCIILSPSGYICYDDGCHLRKYACNPIRKDSTVTAQKISTLW